MKKYHLLTLFTITAASLLHADDNLTKLTFSPQNEIMPTISPDGKWLVYSVEKNNFTDLHYRELNGSASAESKVLAPHPTDDFEPHFSPDGKHLIWKSTRQSPFGDYFSSEFPSSTATLLTDRLYEEKFIGWLKIGDYYEAVFEQSETFDSKTIYAVSLENSEKRNNPSLNALIESNQLQLSYRDDTNENNIISKSDGDDPVVIQSIDTERSITPPITGLVEVGGTIDSPILTIENNGQTDLYLLSKPYREIQGADQANRSLYDVAFNYAPLDYWEKITFLRNMFAETGTTDENIQIELFLLLKQKGLYTQIEKEFPPKSTAIPIAQYAIAKQDPSLIEQIISNIEKATYQPAIIQFLIADLYLEKGNYNALLLSETISESTDHPTLMLDANLLAAKFGVKFDSTISIDIATQQFEALDEKNLQYRYDIDEIFKLWKSSISKAEKPSALLNDLESYRSKTDSNISKAICLREEIRLSDLEGYRDVALIKAEELSNLELPTPFLDYYFKLALAEFYSSIQDHEKTLELLDDLQISNVNAASDIQKQKLDDLKTLVINNELARGNRALQLRDNRLAHTIFYNLQERFPDLLEASRGYCESRNRIGLLTEDEVGELKKEARETKTANAWYRYGLATSYFEEYKDAEKAIVRAIELNGSVPYFYQTYGFLLEQKARESNQRGDLLTDALRSYEIALSFVDQKNRPLDYARLLQNIGLVAFEAGSDDLAFDFLSERLALGINFDDPRSEFLINRALAITAFRRNDLELSREQIELSLEVLQDLRNKKLLEDKVASDYRLELQNRSALVELELQNFSTAAELFLRIADKSESGTENKVRALRNAGFVTVQDARFSNETDRFEKARQARTILQDALNELESIDEFESEDSSKGIFNFGFLFGSNDQSTANIDFKKSDEKRLIETVLVRIESEFYPPDKAIKSIDTRLERLEPDEARTLAQAMANTVLLDEKATIYLIEKQYQKSFEQLFEAYQSSFYGTKNEQIRIVSSSVHFLIRMSEIALEHEIDFQNIKDTFEEKYDVEIEAENLQELIQQFVAANNASPALTLENRASLKLMRALFYEQNIQHARSPQELLLYRTLCEILTNQIEELTFSPDATSSIKRWYLLSLGLRLRMSNDLAESDRLLNQATTFAELNGYGNYNWWLMLQSSDYKSFTDSEVLNSFLNQLKNTTPNADSLSLTMGQDFLNQYAQQISNNLIQSNQYQEVFDLVENLRAFSRKHRFANLEYDESNLEDEERLWYQEYLRLKGIADRSQNLLQRSPVILQSNSIVQQHQSHKERLMQHINDGVSAGLGIACIFGGIPLEGANPAVVLSDFSISGNPIAVLINSGDQVVCFTSDNDTQASKISEFDFSTLAKHDLYEYALDGSSISDEKLNEQNLTSIKTSSITSTLLASSRFPLSYWPEAGTVSLQSENLSEVRSSIRQQDEMILKGDLNLNADSASRWFLGNYNFPLIASNFNKTRSISFPEIQNNKSDFVDFFTAQGTSQLSINNKIWSASLFDINDAPDLALAELDAELAKAISLLNEGRSSEAILSVRRIYLLRRIMDAPVADQMEAAQLLASLYGDTGQSNLAVNTLSEMLGNENLDSDQKLILERLRGSYATDALDWEIAYQSYSNAKDIAQEKGDNFEAWDMTLRSGIVRENQGLVNEAISIFQSLADEISNSEYRLDTEFEYLAQRNIGRIYLRQLSQYLKAVEAFENAKQIAEIFEDDILIHNSELDIARALERSGRLSVAQSKADDVLSYALENENRSLELNALLLDTYLKWVAADYLEAFISQRRAEELARQLSDENSLLITINDAALISWALNDLERANTAINQAISIAQDTFDELNVASTYNNLSIIKRSEGNLDQAISAIQKSLEIDDKRNNRWGLAYDYRNIALIKFEQGRYNDAANDFKKSLQLTEEIGDEVNQSKAALGLGLTYLEANQITNAENYLTQARTIAEKIRTPEVQWRALYGLAQIEETKGNTSTQQRLLEDTISIIERLRAQIKIEEFQDGFLLDKQQVFDDYITLRYEAGDIRAAYEMSERSRSRYFIDLLGNQRFKLLDFEDEEVLRREEQLRYSIETLELQLSGEMPEAERQRLENLMATARQAYEDFLLELRVNNPELADFVSVDPLRLPQSQELLDENTKIVNYHVTEDSVIIFVISNNQIFGTRRMVSRENLSQRIDDLRQRIQIRSDTDFQVDLLSSDLIAPIMDQLNSNERLIIIPHRELHLLPFACLRKGDEYIIEDHSLLHSPSVSVLQYTQKKERGRSNEVLAIGNPDLNNPAFNLPMAQKEAERMTWSFPGATVLTREEATEAWLRENINEYGIVHLAMHGEFKPETPMLSALRLRGDQTYDGQLTAAEIFSLSINADLVALSACQTGLGRITPGDEVVGLNRSFVYAGTRQILSTLWRVDDVTTSVLIKYFYREMDEGSRSEALRQAQLRILNETGNQHPAYWAGITLSGAMD